LLKNLWLAGSCHLLHKEQVKKERTGKI